MAYCALTIIKLAWSAPSAIGTAGMGFGGQAGAEVTDFLFVLSKYLPPAAAWQSDHPVGRLAFGRTVIHVCWISYPWRKYVSCIGTLGSDR
jgi:hypothetical protein